MKEGVDRCPSRLVPPQKGMRGIAYAEAILTILTTSSVLLGKSTAPGIPDGSKSTKPDQESNISTFLDK